MNIVAHAPLRAASILVSTLGLLNAAQSTFDFHSNIWVNLHHFLYEQASSKSPEPSDSKDWQRALDAYRRDITPHQLLSQDIGGINASLAQVEDANSLK